MKFYKSGIYLTEGGHLVKLSLNGTALLSVIDEYGTTLYHWDKSDGTPFGSACDLPFKNLKLKTLTDLKNLPTLPEGYEWANPLNKKYEGKIVVLEKPSNLEFIPLFSDSQFDSLPKHPKYGFAGHLDGLRPIVVKNEDWVEITNPDHIMRSVDWVKYRDNEWEQVLALEGKKYGNYCSLYKLRCLRKDLPNSVVESVQSPVSIKKEEIMNGTPEQKISTAKNVAKATTKFVGKLAWKTANYWLVEPAKSYASRVLRSVRYVTFLGIVAGGIYGYNNPDKIVGLIKDCVPKITIESPEIFKS